MSSSEKIVYCADAIARYGDSIVIVERLGSVKGLALPGGKQNPGEALHETAVREFAEETGMLFEIYEVLATKAEDGRDPRGKYVSTVFVGRAHGSPRDEPGKTKVRLLDPKKFEECRHLFIIDHASILEEYLVHYKI